MKKRSYMVAVQVTIKPTIYVEVLAASAKDAVTQLQGDLMGSVKANLPSFLDECRTDLEDVEAKQVRLISCGRSSLYHSDHECEICQSVARFRTVTAQCGRPKK